MGRFRSGVLSLAVTILCFGTLPGCGGKGKSPGPGSAGRVNLTPNPTISLALGTTLNFLGSVQSASGTILNAAITYSSSDTSILTLAPNGVACAGHWDAAFTACTPGSTGEVQVTATAAGATSAPTYVFVHAPIDSISVVGVLLDGLPVQEPCLSQGQSMTLEAHAFSRGSDITASVGPFTWSANNLNVVKLTPLVNTTYTFPTNQVTATAETPGITNISASANGVASTSLQQPQYTNSQGATSPVLDFFATCPIQSISLELGTTGSGQTSFVAASKGASLTAVATITDVMGNSSLPNTTGGVVLSKIPLTWTASQPGALATGAGCTNTCALTTPSPGAGTITASCSPPTCNIGFPEVPLSLSTPAQIAACTQFFHTQFPQFISCQELIPVPVYAAPVLVTSTGNIPLTPATGAISGVITGTTSTPAVFAASLGCAQVDPSTCTTSVYNFAKSAAGSENPLPVSPNSFLFDLPGDKIYMGSDYGAEAINPTNFGTNNGAFTGFNTVTGKILAASANGATPIFSDTVHTPNQVYVINLGVATALNIPAATAAAFSPDGLKAFILGNNGSSLYIYSALQALQGPIGLTAPGNAIAFSPNGAFAYIAETSTSGSANLTAFSTCSNQVAATLALPANPILMKVLPNAHLDGRDSYGNLIPDGVHILILDATGFDVITSTVAPPASGTLCPQSLTFVSGDPLRSVQRVELGEGTIQPVNFFASADGSQLYVVSSNSSSIFVYNLIAGSVIGGIQLLNNALPVSADIAVDTGTIVVAGSDGTVHEISTAFGGADLIQVSFPNLPNFLNPFCSFTPASGPCQLTTVLAKP